MQTYKYPCTGYVQTEGFGEYLEQEIKDGRANIRQFTNELKEKYHVPFLSLVNSGSSANLVAAMAMAEKIKKKNKPLTAAVSAFTFPTTMSALVYAGFEIQIVDVEKNGFNMDVNELIRQNTIPSLIVPTHFLGFPCEMKVISEYAQEHDCLILQDGCETLNLLEGDVPYFMYGDMTTWSFYHPHHLSSYGGGGIICLNREDYFLVDSIGHWGRSCKCHIDPDLCTNKKGPAHQFTYERPGLNVEMSELNACFGRWQLRSFDQAEVIRKHHYQILYNKLKDANSIQVYEHPDIAGSLFVFPIRLKDDRNVEDAFESLSKNGVEIRTLMGGVINEQKAFDYIDQHVYENAHEMAEKAFFVGIHQTLSDAQVKEMANILFDYLR